MITYTFDNVTHTINPNENGFYSLNFLHKTSLLSASKRPTNFLRSNNKSWEGQFVSVRGGLNQGSFGTKEMAIAYLQWLKASSIQVEGVEVRVIKAERAEVAFGNSVVDKMFANYTVIRQYQVLDYRIDFYIPELNIAVEYDEPQHNSEAHKKADALREAEVKRKLGCTFIRVPHE